jgi:hypothetical protein
LAGRVVEVERARLAGVSFPKVVWGHESHVRTLRAIAAATSTLRAKEHLQSVQETLWQTGGFPRTGLSTFE